MLRDIVKYKMQFLSIFLMAFIGVFVFTGMYVDTTSFETTIDNYYEDSNLADGWIYSNYLVDEFVYQVYLLGATTDMERQLVVESNADLDNHPDVMLHFVENNTLSQFYLLEGKPLDINDSEGVWMDKNFADARNLKIGDEITFESNGTEITKVIRGLGYSPEYTYIKTESSTLPNHTSTGFAYLSYKAFPEENITYNVLNVKFDGTPETFSKLLDYRLEGYYTTFLKKSDHYSVNTIDETTSQQKSLSSILPSIFIFISMIMLLTTMKRIISHQRTQIGILKANGFKNSTITWYYLLPGFLVVTLGSLSGSILGPIVFHIFTHPSRTFYFKFPYWVSIGFLDFAIIIPIIGAISLIVTYYSIKDIVNESSSTIMKPKPPKSSTLSLIERLPIWKVLPFNFRWNYRNIKRNKFRSLMAIFGVIGCTVLLITGFALYEQLNETKDWYFHDVNHFESKMIIDENTDLSQIDYIAEEVKGEPIMESAIEISNNNTTEVVSLLVMDKTDLITLTNDSHDKIEIADDEVSISQKRADLMNISIGDTIDCHLLNSNETIKIKIDKIHSSPFSQVLVMSPNKLEELGIDYTPTSIVTAQHINESYDGIINILYLNDLINDWTEMEKIPMMIIDLLVFFAVLLALVILYNLNLLSFTEMENEIATLKVLGFKSKYLTKLFATQSLFIIIVGFLLGIPISKYILSLVIPAFGKKIYLVNSISFTNLAIAFIIIISVSIIMNLYFSRKIKNLDMAESIKYLEI